MEKEDLLNIKPKKNIKKPLIYGAIAFLLFIIAVISYAIYSNASNKENIVLPPQVNENTNNAANNSEFKEVPIEEDTNTLSQKLIANSSKEENNTVIINNNENEEDKTKKENETVKNEKIKEKSLKPQKTVKKDKKENKISTNLKNLKQKEKYYIQVAALMKYKPNKNFLHLIKKEGFNYTVYHTYIIKNNKKIPITKILIGPYNSKKLAKLKLKKVKEKITQNAFIFKVK
jgi:DedD protein